MNEKQIKTWLIENGGPAIRYRTATELQDTAVKVARDLKAELINSQMPQLWLSRIGGPGGLFSFHGSHPEAFENACIKLSELGIKAATPIFDEKTSTFRRDFAERDNYVGKFVVAGALTRAGYGEEQAVHNFLLERTERLYTMARTKNYDIYIDQDAFSDFPGAFRKRPLVNPDFNGMLPSIYDMLALAYWPPTLKNDEIQHKINTIVDYVLHPDYQAFNDGYGVMRSGPRRYYSMGWSVHLPGYMGFEVMSDGRAKYFIQRLEMMTSFPNTHGHRWIKESLEHLKGFLLEDGTYRFPGRYFREQQSGYWVTGAYTRLDENRRNRISLTVESSFRMLSIKQNMKQYAAV